MKLKLIFTLIISALFFSLGLSKKVLKKVNKTIQTTYNVEEFNLLPVVIKDEVKAQLPRKIGDNNLFKIEATEAIIGYAYIDQAPSKTATYDFLVLFDTDLIVTKSKVLIYREEYGGEIGSKRWLKQFIGSSKEDTFKLNENIIAIAGATISVNSMTKAMNEVLQNIGKLQELNVIN